jgi:ribonuclease HII
VKSPDLSLEKAAWEEGYRLIAGIDEAGRGAWAGPVAAAAVVLPPPSPELGRRLDGVRDSKTLTGRQRDRLFDIIISEALAVGIGMVSIDVIVNQGIAAATQHAMAEAIQALDPRPDFLVIDYVRLPQVAIPQKSVRRGDAISLSIAAASIIAKVSRDRLMVEAAATYPAYGFDRHKGYGTRAHREVLSEHGFTAFHRHTWAPFQAYADHRSAPGRQPLADKWEAAS